MEGKQDGREEALEEEEVEEARAAGHCGEGGACRRRKQQRWRWSWWRRWRWWRQAQLDTEEKGGLQGGSSSRGGVAEQERQEKMEEEEQGEEGVPVWEEKLSEEGGRIRERQHQLDTAEKGGPAGQGIDCSNTGLPLVSSAIAHARGRRCYACPKHFGYYIVLAEAADAHSH